MWALINCHNSFEFGILALQIRPVFSYAGELYSNVCFFMYCFDSAAMDGYSHACEFSSEECGYLFIIISMLELEILALNFFLFFMLLVWLKHVWRCFICFLYGASLSMQMLF